MKHLLDQYGLSEADIHRVVAAYEQLYRRHGVAFEYVDNSRVKEFEDQSDFETATSNGARVLFERDYEKAGGIAVRLFDMYHLIGHYAQWNYQGTDGVIQFLGDHGWEVGITDFTKPYNDTAIAIAYENEAARIGVHFLQEALASISESEMTAQTKQAVAQYMADFQAADLKVLAALYNDGKELPHEAVWHMGSPALAPIAIDPALLVPKERESENLAVLHFDGHLSPEAKFFDAKDQELSTKNKER